MNYNTWVKNKFPFIISTKIATNNEENSVSAIYALKDREFNLINIIDDIVTIYNSITEFDDTLFFDRYYFIFRDIKSNIMKVLSVENIFIFQYTTKVISYDVLANYVEIKDVVLRENNEQSTI